MKGIGIFIISAILTPLIIIVWGLAFPPSEKSRFNKFSAEELKNRNNLLEVITQWSSLLGLAFPLLYFTESELDAFGFWIIGFAFGSMVAIPCSIVALVTLPKGRERFFEYWRFYELKYGIGIQSILVLVVFSLALLILSSVKMVT